MWDRQGLHADQARRGEARGDALLALLPLAAALLLLAVHRQQSLDSADWESFFGHALSLTLAAAPLILAHLLASKKPRPATLGIWVAVVALYPLGAKAIQRDGLLSGFEWILLTLASATSLFLEQKGPANMLGSLRRLPLTLDGVVLTLLSLWALTASSLFIATPDPVENQPLKIWFDGRRIVNNPALFASYIGQFTLVAGMMFGFYWLCRHLLVRRLLPRRGWISFFAGSLALWSIYTPIACSIVLLLPLNTSDWSLIPSETANPFLSANYRFTAMLWVVICPVMLASERLLAQANAANLRHAQARAELQLLQQQVNPHFLFNTLNTLYALCLKDNATSAQAIVKLSDLLRYSIYEVESDWVPLDGEIAHLRNYLDLQLLRFADHCRVEEHLPETADGLCIPPQLLIMLVENMFKHGVERSAEPVTIQIKMSIEAGAMEFRCVNSPVAPPAPTAGTGLGLANVRRRLELLCGNDVALESGMTDEGWTARLAMKLQPC